MRKGKREEGKIGNEWLNTFADLMNLLLCFFVLLFSMSSVDSEKYEAVAASLANTTFSIFNNGKSLHEGEMVSGGVSQLDYLQQYLSEQEEEEENTDTTNEKFAEQYEAQKEEAVKNLYESVSDRVEQKKIEEDVSLSIDQNYNYVKLTINGAILFDSGKAEIKKEAKPVLNKLGDILKKYQDYRVMIEGHTDNRPIQSSVYPSNLWLSTARACTVYEYFIEKRRMDPKRLESCGRSEYDPIASNATAAGRAKNRRVEIMIYYQFDQE